MRFSRWLFAACLALSAAPILADDPRILLRAGHVLDVRSGQQAADQTIVISGDRIIGISATAATPKQDRDSEVGKWADIICVAGDPLKDITLLQKVGFVMKAGVVYRTAAN